jgi:hypothetical protein
MYFFNGVKLNDIIDGEVDVYLKSRNPHLVSTLTSCQVFVEAGQLHVDCLPGADRKHVAPMPEDAVISRNDDRTSTGRIRVFVHATTHLGTVVLELTQAKTPALAA